MFNKYLNKVIGFSLAALALGTNASAAFTAPDVTEVLTAIGLIGAAAISIKLAFIVWPIVMKGLNLLTR